VVAWPGVFVAAALVVAVPLVGAAEGVAAKGAAAPSSLPSPPRAETLYTTGTAAGPPDNFNPLSAESYTGTQGLLYEPLFLYDPVHGSFLPWLASAGTWVDSSTYVLSVRSGVNWVASQTGKVVGRLSAEDVAYSINLAISDTADPYHAYVGSALAARAAGATVTVRFRRPAGYAEWQEYLWHAPVLPKAIWSEMPSGEQVGASNREPVATGPMLLYSTSPAEACYRDNPYWWAKSELGLSFRFSYLCDLVTSSAGAGLSELLDGKVDWSNQLLRGIPNLADSKASGYGIKTYYPGQPYMLPASTVWLEMDTARAPMASRSFRRAVAFALDPSAVASSVYTGTVEAANPTGLLPELSGFVDKAAVKKYGFYHSLARAKKYLKGSAYKGQLLTLLVPEGLPDFADAARLLSEQLAKARIKVAVKALPQKEFSSKLASGAYDMALVPGPGLSSTPWAYFDDIYQLPLRRAQEANLGRFSAPADWALVERAGATPTTDLRALGQAYSALEADFLKEVPVVPLWYAGAWFQANTARWGGYPSASDPSDDYTPVMWHGWLGATTTVYALAALRPEHKATHS
jgi:peptide/nickel transport system substrate-binding protein